MLSFFRRVANSKIGVWVIAVIGIAILGGFALAGLSNVGTGTTGLFGMSSSTLAQVGDQAVDERDLSDVLQRRLQQVRQQQPTAGYASIMGDFGPILDELIDQRTIMAFADKYGFPLSKRLVDAEIAQIPGAKGYDGKFSEQAYGNFLQQQHLTDPQLRSILTGSMLQRMMLTPVAAGAHVPLGMATPYADMLLEQREGDVALLPANAFKAGLKPTEAELQQFYDKYKPTRYMIPEQRVIRIARIGSEQVANVTASDKEIADYYNQHKDSYAPADTRSLSQVVVQDQATANGIAQRAKTGGNLAAAAAPAGANAAVTTLADQTKTAYAGVAGDKAATAVFSVPSGAVVGPIKGQFGWIVVRVDSIKNVPGKTLDQARAEIADKLNVAKRKGAIEDLVDQVQNALDHGSNFEEAVRAAKLPITTTPPLTAAGASRSDPSFKLQPELVPVVKAGFETAPSDPPEMVTLPGDAGYAVVAPGQVTPATAAPLASIRDQVTNDWITDQATQRARAAAEQIASKANGAVSLADAVKAAAASVPAPQHIAARRIQISNQQGQISPALKLLFTTRVGKAQMAANPQGDGYFVVKVDKDTPGNSMVATNLIGQVSGQLSQAISEDYAAEFVADMKRTMKAKRNESAVQAFRARLLSNGG